MHTFLTILAVLCLVYGIIFGALTLIVRARVIRLLRSMRAETDRIIDEHMTGADAEEISQRIASAVKRINAWRIPGLAWLLQYMLARVQRRLAAEHRSGAAPESQDSAKSITKFAYGRLYTVAEKQWSSMCTWAIVKSVACMVVWVGWVVVKAVWLEHT